MRPGQGHDSGLAAACPDPQADCCDRPGRYLTSVARAIVEHLAETGEPGVGEEPFLLVPGVQREGLARIFAALSLPLATRPCR